MLTTGKNESYMRCRWSSFILFQGVFLEYRAVLHPRKLNYVVHSKASKVGARTVTLRGFLSSVCPAVFPPGPRKLDPRNQERHSEDGIQFQDLSFAQTKWSKRRPCPGKGMGESLNPLRRGWGISGSSAGSLRFS